MSDSDAHDGAGPDGHPLDVIFRPRGVAVVGGLDPARPGRAGWAATSSTRCSSRGYDRDHALYAVNPKMTEVRGVACYHLRPRVPGTRSTT